MDNNVETNESKYKYIVESTILEVNRVLNIWKLNDKNKDYDDRLSLFRSYFSKFFKQKFSWIMYNEYIRKNYPVCIIQNYKLLNIDLNLNSAQTARSAISRELNDYINNFDFIKFNDLHPITQQTKEFTTITNLEGMVDYKKLENIKF